MKTFYFEDTPGQTIYAFPEAQSLASWASLRVSCTEAASPNTGRYSVSLDETLDWVLFAGASQPATFDDNIGKIPADTSSSSSIITLPGSINQKARNNGTAIDIAIDSQSQITRSVYDSSQVAINLSALGSLKFCVSDQDGNPIASTTLLTISGADNNTFTVRASATMVAKLGNFLWALRTNDSYETEIVSGPFNVEIAANN